MAFVSPSWLRDRGGYYKEIGSRTYRIKNEGGYWSVYYLNQKEILGYWRKVKTYPAFEVATLGAETHAQEI